MFSDMKEGIRGAVDDAVALYDEHGQDALDMINSAGTYDTYYPFVLDIDAKTIAAHGKSQYVGINASILTDPPRPIEDMIVDLESDGSIWIMDTFRDGETGKEKIKKILLVMRDDYLIGSSAYLDSLKANMMSVMWITNSAVNDYVSNGTAAFVAIDAGNYNMIPSFQLDYRMDTAMHEQDNTTHREPYYPFVLDQNNMAIVAHGADSSRVGDISKSLTASNKPLEQIQKELKQNNGTWVTYTFLNPDSDKLEMKLSWLTVQDNYVFGAGFYPDAYDAKKVDAMMTVDEALAIYAAEGAPDAFDTITALNRENPYPFVIGVDDAVEIADGSVLDRRGIVTLSPYELSAYINRNMDKYEAGQGAWTSYTFYNPSTEQVQAKTSWTFAHGDYLFGAGYYPDNKTAAKIEVKSAVAVAVEMYKELSTAAFDEITAINSKVQSYPFVLDSDMVLVAHGANSDLVGSHLEDLITPDKSIDEINTELAEKGSSWIAYEFTNPETEMVEEKRSLLEAYDGYIFGSGYYTNLAP